MKNADRASEMLRREAMTRYELERRLNTSQQRVSEILRAVGAQIVGYEPPARQGQPAPIYAIGEPEAKAPSQLGRVSSVWQLGAQG